MSLLKLSPSFKDYLWGGTRLKSEYGKVYEREVLAESWELSLHEAGPTYVVNGPLAGKSLEEYIQIKGKSILGLACERFEQFPILIKLIDAKENLSIQVHPENGYALANENQYGKTEMWYILDALEGAYLYYGFNREVSKEEFEDRIKSNTLLEVLNKVPVKKGDVFFIEAGTIHAIGAGIVIAEIQQNSNVTYRVYDYGRVDKDGNQRELHIDQALQVTHRHPVVKKEVEEGYLATSDYFKVSAHTLTKDNSIYQGEVSQSSFHHILVVEGSGHIRQGDEALTFTKGESFFIEAGSGAYFLEGEGEFILTTIPEVSRQLRVGVDIGGTDTKIGLVTLDNEIIGTKTIPTQALEEPSYIIENIAKAIQGLLTEKNIPLEYIVGMGIGMPGMIDTKNGEVIYSNNIPWEKIGLATELKKYFNLPIKVANDADCATLGEVVAGAAKDYENALLLTLGTGVGSGIVLGGELFTGSLRGGSECGHMVIVKDGNKCTCGQRGCFEAHASGSALIKAGREYMEVHKDSYLWELTNQSPSQLNAKMIFDTALEEVALSDLVKEYIKHLSLGISNLVNIFRPEVVLLGGGISKQGERLLTPIREYLNENIFGGDYGELPELKIATLGNQAGLIGAANLIKIQ